jgi:predicted kinase
MKKILLLSGLPASGKTTYAKETGFKRINKDDIRSMLDDGKWSRHNEKIVLKTRDRLIQLFMETGCDIVIDDTNLDPKHAESIREQVILYNSFTTDHIYELEEKFIDTPLEECIKRDYNREKPVGKQVILKMWEQYLKPEYRKFIPGLPECIVVDIDGTIAQCGNRNIYDGSKAHLDTVIEPVADVVRQYLGGLVKVIFLSGRDEEHRGVTEKWLVDKGLWNGHLFMRKNGDKRADYIVKKELYEEHIKGRYNVVFVLDDRKQVKRMWVQEGLFVLDANQFDIEF